MLSLENLSFGHHWEAKSGEGDKATLVVPCLKHRTTRGGDIRVGLRNSSHSIIMVVAIKGWIGKMDTNTILLTFFSMSHMKSSIVITEFLSRGTTMKKA